MVDTLRDIGPGTIVIAGDVHFKVYKVDSKAARKQYIKYCDRYGTHFSDGWFSPEATVVASFEVEELSAKTVPTTWRGPARSKDCKYHTITLFLGGDQEACHEWLGNCVLHYRRTVDGRHAMVAPDPDPLQPMNVKGFSKMDLICAVIMAHGPSTRDDILRRVAAMEGKPWVVSSNHEYYAGNRQGAIEDHAKVERGKKLYRCTVEGLRRGSAVVDRLGMEAIAALE